MTKWLNILTEGDLKAIEFHAGAAEADRGADMVITFGTFADANRFVRNLGGRVAHTEIGNSVVTVPSSQGGGLVEFPAKRAFVAASGRKFLVQVHVKEDSPWRHMLVKGE